MKILVTYQPPFRRWHRRLGEKLRAASHEVRFEAAADAPRAHRWMAMAERRLYRVEPDLEAVEAPPPAGGGSHDLTIVLAGTVPGEGAALVVSFDGRPGEQSLRRALLSGRAPVVEVRGTAPGDGRVLARGRPAIEDPAVIARAIEQVLPRVETLIVQAVARFSSGMPSTTALEEEASGARARSVPTFLARGLVAKLRQRFGPARGRPAHWRIAWQAIEDGEHMDRGPVFLPDDPSRFRADPFPIEHDGRRFIFFEEFPYATGKGVIGCIEIGADGTACQPRTVLDLPFHLSYPVVLRHEGAVFMMPEMGASRRLQLFRADLFPDVWRPDAVLLDDIVVADATPVRHDDRWWLFAALAGGGGSSWDQLGLFHAPDLLGPWTAHAGNPVLIDAAAARPAGMMWHEGGHLMRVAQDCREGYGGGLAICRVDRLDLDGYVQTLVRRMPPPEGSGATGLHTLNRGAGIEVIDLKTRHPRGPRAATGLSAFRSGRPLPP